MKTKRISFKTDIDLDLGFWAILPAININRHSKSLEFEWLSWVYMFQELTNNTKYG